MERPTKMLAERYSKFHIESLQGKLEGNTFESA